MSETPDYWVKPDGSDTTGDGLTYETAWATIKKAEATIPIAGNKLVYVAGGVEYVENSGAGYWTPNRVFTNPITFKPIPGTGRIGIRGSGGAVYNIRSTASSKGLHFYDVDFGMHSSSTSILFATGALTISDWLFSNCKFVARSGLSAGTVASLTPTSVNDLRFEDGCEMDLSLATSCNCLLAGVLNNAYFDLLAYGPVSGTGGFFRIQEADGIHEWAASCDVQATGAAIAVNYEGTALAPTIDVRGGASILSSGNRAMVVSGGSAGAFMDYVNIEDGCIFDGGLQIDAYITQVLLGAGDYMGKASTHPGASIQSDGVTGTINSLIARGGRFSSVGGHGLLAGIGIIDAEIVNCSSQGLDHGMVDKSGGGIIASNRITGGSLSGLLLKGAGSHASKTRNKLVKYNHITAAQAGSYALDIRDNSGTLADDILATRNTLWATGSAKALNVTGTGIGNNVQEFGNYVPGNRTADILSNALTDLQWNSAYSGYAITTNGIERPAVPLRRSRLAGKIITKLSGRLSQSWRD